MSEGSDISARLKICKSNCGLVIRVVAVICWNIWRERNNKIFNNTSYTVDGCVLEIYIDISCWIGLLSDREMIYVSENDNN